MDLIINYLVEIMERGVLVKFLAIPARKNYPISRCQILWCLPASLSRVPQQHWPIADLPRLQSGCSNPLPSWLRKHCRRNQIIEFETPETSLTVDMIAPKGLQYVTVSQTSEGTKNDMAWYRPNSSYANCTQLFHLQISSKKRKINGTSHK